MSLRLRHVSTRATIDELDLELVAHTMWDVGRISLGPTLALGAGLATQRFDDARGSPTRRSAFAHLGAGLALGLELGGGFALGLEALAESYAFRQRDQLDHIAGSAALRLELALGYRR